MEMAQISLFDGSQRFVFRKPIRLIEFFAGYGSQSSALDELGIRYEHWKICEWAVKSIQAYKDNHFGDIKIDYSKELSKETIWEKLTELGISANYNMPLTYGQIKRMGEKECRKIYNNIKITNNLVNIQSVKGKDLEITDTDIYDYVLTYSFPCQDLSKAGKGAGMAKDSGTRSGLLWEVERILDECNELGNLPQVLLMENVPDVIGTNNVTHFADWLAKLEKLGYHCYWQVLNAKDFGIPQNRDRCFMVSVLGDYYYTFPQTYPLIHKLPNILEQQVDEKFYLSRKALQGKLDTKFRTTSFEGCLPQEDGCCRTLCARDYKDPKCVVEIGEPLACELRCDEGIRTFKDNIMGTLRTVDGCGDKHIIEPTLKEQLCNKLIESGLLKEGMVINHSYTNGLNGKNPNSRVKLEDYIESDNGICNTLTTRPDVLGIAVEDLKNLRIRKLTPKECFRLMGIRDEAYKRIAKHQSRASLYHLAGDSIVVPVLVAIFGQFIDGFNFNNYIDKFFNQLKENKNGR